MQTEPKGTRSCTFVQQEVRFVQSAKQKRHLPWANVFIIAIKYIVMAPPKKLFSFNISEENMKELELVSKIYLNDKLDKEYKLEKLF